MLSQMPPAQQLTEVDELLRSMPPDPVVRNAGPRLLARAEN